HHRRRRETPRGVRETHHVLRARTRTLLCRDEREHISCRHLFGVLLDDAEEGFQVVCIRPDGLWPCTAGGELDKAIEKLVPELVSVASVLALHTTQLRGEDHGCPPYSVPSSL